MLRTFDQHVTAESTQIAMPQVEHIGIALSDLEEALRIFRDILGEMPYKEETIEKDGIRTHFIHGGGVKLELLEAVRPDSAVSKYLERHGGGLHHLAFEVDDLEGALQRLVLLGYDPIDREPRPGADGKVIAFLHPKQTAGILIELCESRRSVLTERDLFYEGRSEVGYIEKPTLLILGDAAAAEPYARRLERSCRLISVLEIPDFDTLGLEQAHLLALDSYLETALAAAADDPSWIQSLSLVCSAEIVNETPKLACPVLVLSPDDEMTLKSVLELRTRIGGSLAVFPSDQHELAVAAVEGYVRANLRRSPRL